MNAAGLWTALWEAREWWQAPVWKVGLKTGRKEFMKPQEEGGYEATGLWGHRRKEVMRPHLWIHRGRRLWEGGYEATGQVCGYSWKGLSIADSCPAGGGREESSWDKVAHTYVYAQRIWKWPGFKNLFLYLPVTWGGGSAIQKKSLVIAWALVTLGEAMVTLELPYKYSF